jgi:hypothetical protein
MISQILFFIFFNTYLHPFFASLGLPCLTRPPFFLPHLILIFGAFLPHLENFLVEEPFYQSSLVFLLPLYFLRLFLHFLQKHIIVIFFNYRLLPSFFSFCHYFSPLLASVLAILSPDLPTT